MSSRRHRPREWLPEAAGIALVIGGSLLWVVYRYLTHWS